MPEKTRTDSICAAIDALNKACQAHAKEGSKWCPRHNEERKKLYANYKSHHVALDLFPEDCVCYDILTIRICSSLEVIKEWDKALRNKYRLLNRCITARACFTEQFFGNDMDFGHKSFWQHLTKQRKELEILLQEVGSRAYELILASQNALWVLERQAGSSAPEKDCSGHEDQTLPSTKATPALPEDLSEVEDPVDVALRRKCREIWERIWTRLARYCAPVKSRFYQERIKVIYACVRRAVYREPSLMLVAQNYQSVTSFLNDSNLDLAIVEKLWRAIKSLYVHDVRAAIDDVLRPWNDGGDFVVVLNARVYKDLSGASLPFHAWGHMTALFLCYTCVRKVCKTIEEIVELTRFAIMNGGGLAQSSFRYDFEFQGSGALGLCGFVCNNMEDSSPRYQIKKCNCVFDRNIPHWSETKNNLVISTGLSLKDPNAQPFVNACIRHPDFMIILRKGANGRIIRSTQHVWLSRTRQANTRAGLKNVSWEFAEQPTCLKDSILEEAKPFLAENQKIDDCFQVVIVDRGEGSMEDLIQKLLQIWFKIYDVKDVVELVGVIGNQYVSDGELQLCLKKGASVLMPNLEPNVLASYKLLWGRGPREDQLVDDEVMYTLPLEKK